MGDYHGTVLPMLVYIFLDCFILVVICHSVPLSKPLTRLLPHRPTSSFLGPSTLASIIGSQSINIATLFAALGLIKGHKDYVKWPQELTSPELPWELGDNWVRGSSNFDGLGRERCAVGCGVVGTVCTVPRADCADAMLLAAAPLA